MQSVSPEEKIPAQAVGKKKNSCKLKIPLPPHHFSNGPSLSFLSVTCYEKFPSLTLLGSWWYVTELSSYSTLSYTTISSPLLI